MGWLSGVLKFTPESVSKFTIRSEGPAVARPGRQAGIKIEE